MLKRFFDFTCSSISLILLSPLFLLIAIAIKVDSPGPVFYRGERVGRTGRVFRIYKFRSMVANADRIGGPSTSEADCRITRVGRYIRKFKIDELSQLMNVWLGDMSLVGPRPEVKQYVAMYSDHEKEVLTVLPGITDWTSLKFHNEGKIIAESGMDNLEETHFKIIRPEKLSLQLKYA